MKKPSCPRGVANQRGRTGGIGRWLLVLISLVLFNDPEAARADSAPSAAATDRAAPSPAPTASAVAPAPLAEDAVLVRIERLGDAITVAELRRALVLRLDWRGYEKNGETLRHVLEELAWTRVAMHEADRQGLPPRERAENEDPLLARFDFPRALALEKHLTRACDDELQTPESARAYYDAHPEAFAAPVRARVARLVLPRDAEIAGQPALAWLFDAARDVAQGARTFDELIKQAQQILPTMPMGDLGYLALEDDSALVRALRAVKPGDLVGPFPDGAYVFLFQVVAKEGGETLPWTLVERQAATIARQHCSRNTLSEARRELKNEYGVRFEENAVDAVLRHGILK